MRVSRRGAMPVSVRAHSAARDSACRRWPTGQADYRRCRSAARLDLSRAPPLVEHARLQRALPARMDVHAEAAATRQRPLRGAVPSFPLGPMPRPACAHRLPPARPQLRAKSLHRAGERASCSGLSEYSPAPTGAATTRVRQGCLRLRIAAMFATLTARAAATRLPDGARARHSRQHRQVARALQRHFALGRRRPCAPSAMPVRQRVGAHAHPLHRRLRRRRPPSASTAAPTQEGRVCVRVCA